MGNIGFACMIILFACATGFFLGAGIYEILRRREVATAIVSSNKKERLVLRLQEVSRSLVPLSTKLLRFKAIDDLADNALALSGSHNVKLNKENIVAILIVISAFVSLIAGIISGSVPFGFAIAAVCWIGAGAYLNNRRHKLDADMREGVPEALRALEASFRSGQSLLQTLQHVGHEIKGGLGRLFSIAAKRLDMGETTTQSLSVLRNNPRIPELSFVAVALDVQHQSGGSVAPVLNSAREAVESELELTRTLRVQTAQARLSASIVTVMPFILVAFFSLMSPDFLAPFFGSILGVALLVLAIVMQLTGVLIVRRMLKVDVG